MSVIDCHQHFQRRANHPLAFPPAVGDRLDRDFTEDDLRPSLAKCAVDQTILVQLHNNVRETEDCLDLQTRVDYIGGVVGWVPLVNPTECSAALERLSGRGKLIGIRHLIAYEPDPQWLLSPEVMELLALLAEANLVFEGVPVNDAQFDVAAGDDAAGCPTVSKSCSITWAIRRCRMAAGNPGHRKSPALPNCPTCQ